MNKTNLKRIIRLYNEGLTTEMAISMIVMLAKDVDQAAVYILQLMEREVFPRWSRHNTSPPSSGAPMSGERFSR